MNPFFFPFSLPTHSFFPSLMDAANIVIQGVIYEWKTGYGGRQPAPYELEEDEDDEDMPPLEPAPNPFWEFAGPFDTNIEPVGSVWYFGGDCSCAELNKN